MTDQRALKFDWQEGIVRSMLTKLVSLLKLVVQKFRVKRDLWLARRNLYSSILLMAKQGKFTEADCSSIVERCGALGLNQADLKSVRAKAYRGALEKVASGGLVTGGMERDLQQIQSFLSIPDSEINDQKFKLSRLRLLSEIRNGNPPILLNPGVILQKHEAAYWNNSAVLLEEKVVGRRYEGGSQGFSFRIAKGVSYRVGNHRGRMITDKTLVAVSGGELMITSKRILFKGSVKSFDIRLDKIMSTSFLDDGIVFTTGSREKPYTLRFNSADEIEVAKEIMSLAMRNFAA